MMIFTKVEMIIQASSEMDFRGFLLQQQFTNLPEHRNAWRRLLNGKY